MIRSELIQKISEENPHLFQRDVERIVNTIFDEIIEAMARGDRVELRGFGAFSVKKRDARTGRNPRTGESVPVEEKHVPFFKTGKLLRDRLNGAIPPPCCAFFVSCSLPFLVSCFWPSPRRTLRR